MVLFPGQKNWLQDVGCDFEMLIDSGRDFYKFLQLKRSASRTWNTDAMQFYAEQLYKERALPALDPSSEDDIHQMGGDLILRSECGGKYVVDLVHRSKSSTHRPSVALLLETIDKNKAPK